MKESIGQAFIVNLILVFFGILVLLFFGSINYSKAFKAKNKIITIIEKYGRYSTPSSPTDETNAKKEIEKNLSNSGYRINQNADSLISECKKICEGQHGTTSDNCSFEPGSPSSQVVISYPPGDATGSAYDYCVFKINSDLGSRYQVISFMQMEIPIFGGILRFPVRGETKVLYDTIKDF